MYSGEAVETGTIKDVFDRMRHPYTQGLFRSIPLPGADKNSRPLISIPGQLPLPHERPHGLQFRAALPAISSRACCDARRNPDDRGRRHDGHYSRCVRFDEIDWDALPPGADKVQRAGHARRAGAQDRRPAGNTTRSAANEIFGCGEGRVVKANETISFEAREAETVAIVGESGCGKSTLAKVLLGLETASAGTVKLGNKRDPVDRRSSSADVADRLVDPDGVPEPVRYAQPQPQRRLADHSHAGEIRRRQHRGGRAASACWSCSTW